MWEQLVEPTSFSLKRPEGFESQAHLDMDELVQRRLFVDIVEKSTKLLQESEEPTNHSEVDQLLQLWLLRLKALLVLRQGSIVAQEAQSHLSQLSELPISEPVWELRLLLIPVWAKGINQQAIQILYQMALELRQNVHDDNAERLRVLGVQVATFLVGMRDYSTAISHLESIYLGEMYHKERAHAQIVAGHLAMLYAHIGNAIKAEEWFEKSDNPLRVIVSFVKGDYEALVDEQVPPSVRALSLLHLGRVDECIKVLEDSLLETVSTSQLFNLFMIYDLVDPSSTLKAEFKNKLAGTYDALGSYDLVA